MYLIFLNLMHKAKKNYISRFQAMLFHLIIEKTITLYYCYTTKIMCITVYILEK
jgi:hypothetical protein